MKSKFEPLHKVKEDIANFRKAGGNIFDIIENPDNTDDNYNIQFSSKDEFGKIFTKQIIRNLGGDSHCISNREDHKNRYSYHEIGGIKQIAKLELKGAEFRADYWINDKKINLSTTQDNITTSFTIDELESAVVDVNKTVQGQGTLSMREISEKGGDGQEYEKLLEAQKKMSMYIKEHGIPCVSEFTVAVIEKRIPTVS